MLVAADQRGQEQFDKTVLSLSGGALGVSFVFLKDVIGANPIVWPSLLLLAWIAWGVSALAVLLSYHFSNLAIRRCIRQIDDHRTNEGTFGGPFAWCTTVLNAAGAVLFFVGVLSIILFACANFSTSGDSHAQPQSSPTAATAAAPASAASGRSRAQERERMDSAEPATAPSQATVAK